MLGSGGTGISGSSDIVPTMGDSEFGGLTADKPEPSKVAGRDATGEPPRMA